MSMVDENDPFKGLKAPKKKRSKFGMFMKFLDCVPILTVAILIVIFGIREEFDTMRFGVLILFYMITIEYVKDIRKEVRALRKAVREQENSLVQAWQGVPDATRDLMMGEPRNKWKGDPKA